MIFQIGVYKTLHFVAFFWGGVVTYMNLVWVHWMFTSEIPFLHSHSALVLVSSLGVEHMPGSGVQNPVTEQLKSEFRRLQLLTNLENASQTPKDTQRVQGEVPSCI